MSANLLSGIPLFSDFPSEELDRVLSTLDKVHLKTGEILFYEGDSSENLFIVVDGILEIVIGFGTDQESIIGKLYAGDYLGELSIFMSHNQRTATARAQDDVVLLGITRAHFLDLLKRNPESALATYRDLAEKNRKLQQMYVEKELFEQELKLAAEIQMSILPTDLPVQDKYDFGGRILPARQVGGDFYDVFDLGNNEIGVLIGDVADKGIPSAIFMARTHALIIAEADSALLPGEVLRKVNKHIAHLEKSTQFVTVLYGVLDVETGEFSFARAGHEPPLLLNPHGDVQRLSHKPGMALGLREDIILDEYSLFLEKGSMLIMFTDGMTDCRNPKGEAFGLERIKSTMTKLKDFNAQTGCDRLFDTLMTYQNGSKQDDDVTLVAVHAK